MKLPQTIPTISITCQSTSGGKSLKYSLFLTFSPDNMLSIIPDIREKAVLHPSGLFENKNENQSNIPMPAPAMYGDHRGSINSSIIPLTYLPNTDLIS